MTPAPPSRWRLVLALALPLLSSVAAAQSPAYSRAIPGFARPIGSADPAARVRYLGGADALPLRAHPGGSSAPDSYLYRRAGDGSYRPAVAPSIGSWPAAPVPSGDPALRLDLALPAQPDGMTTTRDAPRWTARRCQ